MPSGDLQSLVELWGDLQAAMKFHCLGDKPVHSVVMHGSDGLGEAHELLELNVGLVSEQGSEGLGDISACWKSLVAGTC